MSDTIAFFTTVYSWYNTVVAVLAVNENSACLIHAAAGHINSKFVKNVYDLELLAE